uniref:Angiotensin II receptor associated protein n=1 Tax=Paramormyrops kingsleyae TaxID=1676925 RepID=A0A3B3SHB6_9TELE
MDIPAVDLKVIVLLHWMLSIWVITAWFLLNYAWANCTMLALGVWAVAQKDSLDAVVMFLFGMALTILTDSVQLGLNYPGDKASHEIQFSFSMAIISLLLKPISCFCIYRTYRARGGSCSIGKKTASGHPEPKNLKFPYCPLTC